MNYKFAVENNNYEDYSSGRVFYNQHGTTSFPIRLASEIYQRCTNILMKQGFEGPYTLYDPCCGGAYLLTALGYLHGNGILKIYSSDVDEKVITLAERNLSLLSEVGLSERVQQIKDMISDFGKKSHLEALQSAYKLKNILVKRNCAIDTKCFVMDITKNLDLASKVNNINIIVTDLPYGDIVNWNDMQDEDEAIVKLLNNVHSVMTKVSVIAIISKKKTKIQHDKYRKVEQFTIGKRQVTFIQPIFGD